MSQQKRIDRILEEVRERAQTEVGALLGASFVLTSLEKSPASKSDCFADLVGQQVCALLDISGDIEGKSCLLIGIKDAIQLGGTLIMLPASELNETIAQENYSEDIEDSFGEIANILAGSYTKVFEENYPQSCRFVRKEQELLKPAKVDIESDLPIPDQMYYRVSSKMELNGKTMGELIVLLPAATFDLSWEEKVVAEKSVEIASEQPVEQPVEELKEPDSSTIPEEVENTTTEQQAPVLVKIDADKNKKRIDSLLSSCFDKVGDEVGALLGTVVTVTELQNEFIGKEEFFLDKVKGKQVVTDFEMAGDLTGVSYFVVSVKDALYIGGVLVMLPPSELELVVQEEDFDDDARDAYGEIANIIAGVYSGVFEANYSKKLRFIRRDMDEVAPVKVDISSEEPLPDEQYYLSSMAISVNEHSLGRLQLLLPAKHFDLIATPVEESVEAASVIAKNVGESLDREVQLKGQADSYQEADNVTTPIYDILIISDAPVESKKLIETLEGRGYSTCCIDFNDNVYNYLPGRLKAVYLVMKEVNEQAFGVAIKVSSSGNPIPLIAAGPGWTRSTVIKAVKYGIRDILLTPAESTDILENIDKNLVSLAA